MVTTLYQIALWVIVLGIMAGATRIAVARPAWFTFTAVMPGGKLGNACGIILTSAAAVFLAGALFPFLLPLPGAPYISIAVTCCVAAALTWRTESWTWFILATGTVAACGAAWMIAATWLTYSAGAVFVMVALIVLLRPRLSFWQFAAVQLACAAWDYYGVIATRTTEASSAALDPFVSNQVLHGPVFGEPVLLGLPHHLAMLSTYVVAIGVGDVAMPGLLIVIAGRAGARAGTPWLYRAGIIGYMTALAAGFAALRFTPDADLPALDFVIPGIIIAVSIAAWKTGTWGALNGNYRKPSGIVADDAVPVSAEA